MINESHATPVFVNPFTEQTAGKYFVGREDQIKQFDRALSGLAAGQPRHLYVAGIDGTGKTSYLAKLLEIAESKDLLAVMPTLDPAAGARQHVATILKALINGIDERARKQKADNAPRLIKDWDKAAQSAYFLTARIDRLEGDDLRNDLIFIQESASEAGAKKIVVCIDEGQRIHPFALSAMKNSLQNIEHYLIILSLRIIDDKSGATEAGRRILEGKAQEAEGDFGASRFFLAGVPLGAFATDKEVQECLIRRLDGNAISFSNDVIHLITRITGRLPRKIIALASDAYEATADADLTVSTREILRRSFESRYREQYIEALNVRGQLSGGARQNLKALIELDRPATAEALASHMYPTVPASALVALADGIKGDLDRICRSSLCIKKDDRYEICDPVIRYALELSLESQ